MERLNKTLYSLINETDEVINECANCLNVECQECYINRDAERLMKQAELIKKVIHKEVIERLENRKK